MEEEIIREKEGIEEISPLLGSSKDRSVKKKVPEVEIHLYKQGKGPIAVFQSALGGWDQDQLEVRDILEQFGLKSIYAFKPQSGRGVSIPFHPRNGRSLLPFKDGTVIHIDGDPKDPLIKPITKVLVITSFIVLLVTLLYSENPTWLNKFRGKRIPPWLITCAVIIFTRLRNRTQNVGTGQSSVEDIRYDASDRCYDNDSSC
ncbi:hypothetical protein V2J09_007635 [Rumex salicifolius]